MALKLDNTLLMELGLGALPESEKQLLLRQIYEKLEMNVGMRLADQMSNEQLDAFEKFVDANDDKGAFQWLEANFPNYKMVVNEEFEKLKAEIHSVAPQIMATASQQLQTSQAPPLAQPIQQVYAGQQSYNGQQLNQSPVQNQYNPQSGQQLGQYQGQQHDAQANTFQPIQAQSGYNPQHLGSAAGGPNQPVTGQQQYSQPQQLQHIQPTNYSQTDAQLPLNNTPSTLDQQADHQTSQPQYPQQQPPAGSH